jgi:hypothetical protein
MFCVGEGSTDVARVPKVKVPRQNVIHINLHVRLMLLVRFSLWSLCKRRQPENPATEESGWVPGYVWTWCQEENLRPGRESGQVLPTSNKVTGWDKFALLEIRSVKLPREMTHWVLVLQLGYLSCLFLSRIFSVCVQHTQFCVLIFIAVQM